jgi:PAS domain S-box-containing protein
MKREPEKQVIPQNAEGGKAATELKYDGIPEVVLTGNSSFLIDSMNKRALLSYGQVVGQKCHKVLRNKDAPCEDCLFAAAGRSSASVRYISKSPRGENLDIIETRLPTDQTKWTAIGRPSEVVPVGHMKYREIALILDSVGDGVAIVDPNGNIIYTNRSQERLYGYSPGELFGKPFSIFTPPGAEAVPITKIIEETAKGSWGGLVAHARKDSSKFWASLKTAPLRDKEGKIVASIVISRDVSEIEKTQESLEKEIAELEKRLEQENVELSKRFSQLKILQDLGKRMVISSNEEEIANNAAAALVETMDYAAVGVVQLSETKDGGGYQFLGEHTKISPGKYGRKINEQPIIKAMRQRSPVIEKYQKERLSVGIMARSELVIPLIHKDRTIGALVIADQDESRFTREDVSIAQTIADLISVSLATCHSGKQIVDREQALNLLDEITMQTTSRTDLNTILSKTAERVNDIINTQSCLIGSVNPERGIVWIATHGAEELVRDLEGENFYQDLIKRISAKGEVYFINDYLSAPSTSLRDGINMLISSMMISPIRLHEETVGVIVLLNKLSPTGFTEENAALVQNFSNHLAVLMHNADSMASLDYSIKTMNSLLRTTFELQAATGVPDMHQKVADMLLEVIPYDAARFFGVREGGLMPVLSRNLGDKVDMAGMDSVVLEIAKKTLVEKKGWNGIHQLPGSEGEKRRISLLVLPLMGREDKVGAIVIARTAERAFTEQDQEIATLFANHASIALENAMLLSREKYMLDDSISRVKQLESILDLTTSVMSVDRQEEAVKNVLSAMVSVLGFSKGLILNIIEPGDELACMYSIGFSQYESDSLKTVRVPVGDLLSVLDGPGKLVGERTFMLSDRVRREKPIDEEMVIAALRVLSNLRIEAGGDKFIITIEDSQGDIVGVILLSGDPEKVPMSKEEISMLEIYGSLASIALKNTRQFERVSAARADVETLNDLMTHDINNFVQGILGYLDMINADDDADPRHKDYAKRAIEQVENTKRLIENVRKLAWIRTGMQEKLTTYDLGKVIGESLNAVKEAFPKKDVNFISDVGTEEYYVSGDEMINELFVNLFSNSVKYTNSTVVPLELAIKTQYEFGKDYWRIEVVDHGRGIPEDKKQFVFERFGRQDYTPYGFGLGLSIVRNLTRKYNGRVWVENRVPEDFRKGSRFIILLPKIDIPAPPELAGEGKIPEGASEDSTKKVLRKVREPQAKPTSSRAPKQP